MNTDDIISLFESAELKWIESSELSIDRNYQRDVSVSLVDKIEENFNPRLFGTLVVFQRGKRLFVIDGQQRLTAARRLKIQRFPCIVYNTEGMAAEASDFVILNTLRKSVTPKEKFRASLAARDRATIDIWEIVQENNFGIDVATLSNGRRNISCVALLYQLHRRGLLATSLDVVNQAWPSLDTAGRASTIGGVAEFMHSTPRLNTDLLIRKLANTTPAQIELETDEKAARQGRVSGQRKMLTAGQVVARWYRKRSSNGHEEE